MQMRAMVGELGMPSIPSIFPVPRVGSAFDDEGNPSDDSYRKRVDKFMRELEWYAEALKEARGKGLPY
jgi:NAD(P)H-dependent FMN reductase